MKHPKWWKKFVPEDMWRSFQAQGLDPKVEDINGHTEVQQAYDLYLMGYSVGDAVEMVKFNRNKEAP